MRWKRVLAALLAAVMLCGAAAAAGSSFMDVEDPKTAVHADILRLLGVVNGSGGNRFSPNEILTRAQFCAMAIRVLGRENEVRNYENRTIFTDVASRHWARGYVNLAANTMIGDGSTRLIAGVGNGKFLPDESISFAQAVTIVLRMLGYGDEKAGAVWPQGYLDLASSLELGTGIRAAANQSVTRAQAAELFSDLLWTKTASGQKYYAGLGTVQENVILLRVDPATGVMETTRGTLRPALDGVIPTALALHRGVLVTNDKGDVTAFLPESAVLEKRVTLKTDALSGKLTAADGSAYTVQGNTPVYVDGTAGTYSGSYESLKKGMTLSLLLENGTISCIVWDSPTAPFVPEEALVVTGPVNEATFRQLTAGASEYRIEKDGAVIGMEDIIPYDAVTYDPIRKVLKVSDLRLPCYYENAYPNPNTPKTIEVLGKEFRVLAGAQDSIRQFNVGDAVTLLLTADGAVAGMGPAELISSAIGLADSAGVTVALPDGGNLRFDCAVDEQYQGSLVRIGAFKSGTPKFTRIFSQKAPGNFDLNKMTLGEIPVAPNVRIYESFDNVVFTETDSAALPVRVVEAAKVVQWFTNNAGFVDMVVLSSLTGDIYNYGILERTSVSGFAGGMMVTNSAVSVTNGSGVQTLVWARNLTNGVFGGIVAGSETVAGSGRAGDVVILSAVEGALSKDFFQVENQWYVNVRGTVYAMGSEVHGYIRATKKWFSQDLETILAYADTMILHIDPIAQRVRIIEV